MVYLGLGSSLGDRWENLELAILRLVESPGLELMGCSSVYESPHLGLKSEDAERYPAHLNCVIHLRAITNPYSLLNRIYKVELLGGRDRTEKWGPRTIDIDILLFGRRVLREESLLIPHPEIMKRAFVLLPLLELNPLIKMPDGTELAPGCLDPGVLSQVIRKVEDRELLL